MTKPSPKTIAKNVANPLDGIVKLAVEKGWRVRTANKGRTLVLSNRPEGEK